MKDGEFWIVEFRGEVTIGSPIAGGTRWQFVGDMKGHFPDDTFRAVRKIDIAALIDGDPVTVTSLSRLLLGVIVEAGAPLRPPRQGVGAHVRISKETQNDLNPAEWRTVITSDPSDGSVVVEAVKVEKPKHTPCPWPIGDCPHPKACACADAMGALGLAIR